MIVHHVSSFFLFFILLHFSSLSFSFLGCSTSDFFGLNCFKIYCKFYEKIFGPSRGVVPQWAPFSFFSLVYFVFEFPFSFFNFYFSFSFFFVSQEQNFFFSIFLVFLFKYVLLLALVSEFNCFLRSRRSMEMWCPDDIGRDSWDWVGPPAWCRACFNSPEWGVVVWCAVVLLLLLLLLF